MLNLTSSQLPSVLCDCKSLVLDRIIWISKRSPGIEEVAAFMIFALCSFPSTPTSIPHLFPACPHTQPHSQVQGSPLPPSLSLDAEGEALWYSRPTEEGPLQITYRYNAAAAAFAYPEPLAEEPLGTSGRPAKVSRWTGIADPPRQHSPSKAGDRRSPAPLQSPRRDWLQPKASLLHSWLVLLWAPHSDWLIPGQGFWGIVG